jgi:hypothetical protein
MALSEAPNGSERCSWCGREVDRGDGFRLGESPGERRAVFCRLEHIVPWTMRGAHWQAGEVDEPAELAEQAGTCALCGQPVGEVRLLLVRHRGEHRIADGFCSVDHLAAWAKAGGRWR